MSRKWLKKSITNVLAIPKVIEVLQKYLSKKLDFCKKKGRILEFKNELKKGLQNFYQEFMNDKDFQKSAQI